jgi:hypothetical protein
MVYQNEITVGDRQRRWLMPFKRQQYTRIVRDAICRLVSIFSQNVSNYLGQRRMISQNQKALSHRWAGTLLQT